MGDDSTEQEKAGSIRLSLLNRIWDCIMTNIDIDNGGRRFGIDRRIFLYAIHLPERRASNDRRSGINRRSGVKRRSTKRSEDDRRKYFAV